MQIKTKFIYFLYSSIIVIRSELYFTHETPWLEWLDTIEVSLYYLIWSFLILFLPLILLLLLFNWLKNFEILYVIAYVDNQNIINITIFIIHV